MVAPQPEFKRLFEPGWIGQMELKNRIVKPPMGTNYASEEGYISQRMKDYYEQTARGGAGLVIVEATCIDSPVGRGLVYQLVIDDDKYIPGLSELARCIHQNGAKAAIQLHHAGREAVSRVTGLQPVAPSAIKTPWGELPRELTIEEIRSIVACFAKAAGRAKRSGFDGVEIHAAHGYLIAQFLSLSSNKREDDYGGSLKNRARILLEILHAVKEPVGQGYPVWGRINGTEYGIEGGFTLSDAREVARMCQDNGADAIHVSTYGYGAQAIAITPDSPGALIPLALGVKQAISLPVIAVGRITPELGEEILNNKSADFIAMGRALVADPDLPRKVQSGGLADIRPCIGCLECFNSILFKDELMTCSVNAAIGGGEEYRVKPVGQSKRVCVIGGGTAGMETARVAALRGHRVVLYEKGHRLGGQLLAACKPPRKGRLKSLIDYLSNQIERLGVKVELGKEATPRLVQATEPEVVVLATGITPLVPEVSGLSKLNVVTAEEVLLDKVEIGDKVVIIGGGMVGCETAEFLADKGKKVTIVEMTKRVASEMVPYKRSHLLNSLRAKGVGIFRGVKGEEVTDKGFIIKDGERQVIEADTVVLAAGAKPDVELFNLLGGKVPYLYRVGDCVEPHRILEAINDGFRIGCKI